MARAAIKAEALGESASKRGHREDRKARREDALGADAVAERARRQDEGCKRDGVSVHDPLQLRHATTDRDTDRAQSGVDDGDIELNHGKAEAHRRQCQRGRRTRTSRFAVGVYGSECVPQLKPE